MRKRVGIMFCMISLCMGFLFQLDAGRIEWEQTRIEKIAGVNDKELDVVFRFSVKDGPVTILSIRNSCGCTTSKLSKMTYEPGDTGEIEVHFDIGVRVGEQRKYVSLQTDDPDEPEIDLELDVYIPQVVKIEPRFVYWTKGTTPYLPQTMLVKIDADIPVQLKSVTTDQEQLVADCVKNSENEYRIELRLLVPEGEPPFFRAVIKIEVEASVPLKQSVFYAYAFMKT
jgi:hypothetical protein